MSFFRAVPAALALLAVGFPVASGQGSAVLLPEAAAARMEKLPAWRLVPQQADAPACMLALWGCSPFAELKEAGFPLPPSQAEVQALPPVLRLRHQAAMKAALLHRAARSLGERNRVSRENVAESAALARRLGAPELFSRYLLLQAMAGAPQGRYLARLAEEQLLAAYGVDAREIRFFVESCGLSSARLLELEEWLPLPALFSTLPPEHAEPTVASLRADFVAELAVRRDLVLLCRGVHDRASADAAAEAMLPVLLRHLSARVGLLTAPPELSATALAPFAPYAAPVNEAWLLERRRLVELDFFGSPRLKALDYLLH